MAPLLVPMAKGFFVSFVVFAIFYILYVPSPLMPWERVLNISTPQDYMNLFSLLSASIAAAIVYTMYVDVMLEEKKQKFQFSFANPSYNCDSAKGIRPPMII